MKIIPGWPKSHSTSRPSEVLGGPWLRFGRSHWSEDDLRKLREEIEAGRAYHEGQDAMTRRAEQNVLKHEGRPFNLFIQNPRDPKSNVSGSGQGAPLTYMEHLERAERELERAVARMGKDRTHYLGKGDDYQKIVKLWLSLRNRRQSIERRSKWRRAKKSENPQTV